jgi:hypothetical protein
LLALSDDLLLSVSSGRSDEEEVKHERGERGEGSRWVLRSVLWLVQQVSIKGGEQVHRLQKGRAAFVVQHMELLCEKTRI